MSKYLKPDSELGYIEDDSQINYVKFNNFRHVVLGCMLGDFNNDGEYVVSPEIIKELIEMPKYLTETMENMEVCLSELRLDKQISFLVTFEEDKATLSLIEKISYEANFKLNSGTYSNINEYVLDTILTSGEINKNEIYRRWNISLNEGNIIDIFSCDDAILEKYFGIVNRFKYLLVANSLLLDKENDLEEMEAEYANQILNLLKRYPEFEKAVWAQLKEACKDKQEFLQLNKPNYVKTFNEILDNTISQNLNLLNEDQLKDFEQELKNVYLQIYLRRTNLLNFEVVDNIETLDIYQLLSVSLKEIGEDFVKKVKGFTDADKWAKDELKKLLEYLTAQQIIEIKKKEEAKAQDLIQKAQEKAKEKAESKDKAKAADKGKGADKAKGGTKSKGGGGGKKDKKAEKKAGNSDDAKKKAEEEAKKKAEEEARKKAEEEAARRRRKRRIGLIGRAASLSTKPTSTGFVDATGRFQYASNETVNVNEKKNLKTNAGKNVTPVKKTEGVSVGLD